MPDTVLFTVCFSDYYGTQQNIVSTARSLDRSRFIPVIASPYGKDFFRALDSAGVETIELPFRNLFDLETARGIASAVRKHNVSIIHAHLGISTLLSLAASRLAGRVPVIATRHFVTDRYSTISSPLVYNAYRNMYIAMNKGLKRIIFVSEAARRSVEEREGPFDSKEIVIHNAVDTTNIPRRDKRSNDEISSMRKTMGIPVDSFAVLSLSRLSPEKDIPTLLCAAATIKKLRGNFFFIITGEGPLREELEASARALGVDDCVKFTGFIKNKEELISVCDASVLCSSIDSFGISVLESMAGGVPAVSARGGGPLEIITDNENGLFFAPGNPDELAAHLLHLADDRDFAETLSRNGIARASDFDEKKIAKRIQQVYDEILEETR